MATRTLNICVTTSCRNPWTVGATKRDEIPGVDTDDHDLAPVVSPYNTPPTFPLNIIPPLVFNKTSIPACPTAR